MADPTAEAAAQEAWEVRAAGEFRSSVVPDCQARAEAFDAVAAELRSGVAA